MFLVKTVFLCSGIFVLVEGKSYGKNWYPKKYSHSIHKRVDPNYWEDLTLENHLLPIQPLSGNKFTNSNEESESFHSRPWLRRKKHFAFIDAYSPSQVILKRYKRNDDLNSKIPDLKTKRFYKKSQKQDKYYQSVNNSSKCGKNKKPLLTKKLYSPQVNKVLKI